MELYIKKQGITINTKDYGLECVKFRPQSVLHNHQSETIDGQDELLITNTTFGPRDLQASFLIEGDNHIDLELLISELHMLFATKEEITLIDSRQPGKQWKVVVNSVFDVDRVNPYTGTYDLSFLSPRAYCESLGTTLDPFTFDSDLWQIGMNLPADRELIYRHSTNRFEIYNAGIPILPKNRFPLRILFKGTSTNLAIRNVTTDEIFTYNGSTAVNDTILLDGIQHFKNSSNIFAYTNHKVISLMTGWNQFEITGTSGSFEIMFDFRFYYL
ncbi:distal tail protein Dit [Priestia flexa]|uniref:distal tail protein Dit n=1 Tax=Priestia flexa TaxID=86664 RepID=UPI0013D2D689|nr:distal tail protein Dit [Priestia flexa]